MTFQVGTHAVYPGCGVGRVDKIGVVEEVDQEMYILSFPDKKTRVWVPRDNAQELGLRPIMTKEQLDKTLSTIRTQTAPPKKQTWNRRFKRYSEKIQTNIPMALGEVLGELAAIRTKKALSFGERRIYRQVHQLLVREAAMVRDVNEKDFEQELDKVLAEDHTPAPLKSRRS